MVNRAEHRRRRGRQLVRRPREVVATPQSIRSRFGGIVRRCVGWILAALSAVGVGTLFSAYYAHPEVTAVHFDAKEPFLFPCIVSNDQLLLGFHNVVVTFSEYRPDIERNKGATVWGVIFRGTHKPIPYLAPGERRTFELMPFDVAGLPSHLPEHARLDVILLYEIRVVPLYPWHHRRVFRFDMRKDSNGVPYWIGQEANG
jgi:hypothetical protein